MVGMETFWKPKPREPWRDWRTYSMFVPILSGAAGSCIFFALGLKFSQMDTLAQNSGLVTFASFAVAFGSTFGSVGSGIEVFRKRYTGEAKNWDWAGLAISTVTTVVGFALGIASLLGATGWWSEYARVYGIVIAGTLAALDSGGDMIELGGLFGSYDQRMERWLEEQEAWAQRERGKAELLANPFVCDTCGKGFDSQAALSGHKGSHSRGRANGHHKVREPEREKVNGQ